MALVEAGDKEQALATLNQALELAHKIENAGEKVAALSNIASAQVEAGDKEQALGTLKQALALVEAGDIKQAVEVAQTIEDASSKAFSLSKISSVLAKAGDKKQALATLKQAVKVAQKIEMAYFKQSALRDIAMTLATEPGWLGLSYVFSGTVVGRMKTAFTPKEKQLAKQLVEVVQGN